MDIFSRFKKDYVNYLVSIIIPVIINAASIPLFKRILGAEGYGLFSVSFNSVLLLTATLTGWITQSIIRFYPASNNKKAFIKGAVSISLATQLLFFVPTLLAVWYIRQDALLALLFALALLVTSLQFSMLAVSQSVFLSGKNIYSEIIRTVSYLGLALLLLLATPVYYMYALFSAIIISYLLSYLYLRKQSQQLFFAKANPSIAASGSEPTSSKSLWKEFMRYGGPLSLWFVFAYLLSLIDKFFLLRAHGAYVQGNYQAVFDFLSRSITVLISPITTSLFPLLTTAYELGKKRDIKKLLARILLVELAAMLVAGAAYWWFGADILFSLIHVPKTGEYKWMGLLVIAGTFTWQMAIVIQKRYELKFMSVTLLVMVALAFVFQLLLYVIAGNNSNPILYPAGFALSALVYLLFVSFHRFRYFFTSKQQGN
jgi:O-antigen/teichoic acid export membrane protein